MHSLSDSKALQDKTFVIMACLVLIVLTQFNLLFMPVVGILLNALTLITLLVCAVYHKELRLLLCAMSIVPTLNAIGLTFPTSQQPLRLLVMYAGLLACGLIYRRLNDSRDLEIAPQTYFKLLPFIIVIAALIAGLGYRFLPASSLVAILPIYLVIAAAPICSYAEELLLRTLQAEATQHIGKIDAIALSMFVYASLFFSAGIRVTLFVTLIGLVLGLLYAYKKNILLNTTLSALIKIVLALLPIFLRY